MNKFNNLYAYIDQLQEYIEDFNANVDGANADDPTSSLNRSKITSGVQR